MNVNLFSFLTSLIWISVFIKAVTILRKQMSFMKHFSIYPLLFLLFISLLRLFFPFELPYTIVVKSTKILPALRNILRHPLIYSRKGEIILSLAELLLIIWIIFAGKRLLNIASNYKRLYHLVNLLPAADDSRLQMILSQVKGFSRYKKDIKIAVHKEIRTPAVIGFLAPTILLPDIEFTDDELLGILTHEWMHFCYGHAFIKFIGTIIYAFFWWNPLFKQLNSEIAHSLEMHSDKKVSTLLTRQQHFSYLNAIIKVVNNLNTRNHIFLLPCSLVEENDAEKLKQRFEMILENYYSKKKKGKSLIIFVTIFIILIISYLFILQPYCEPDYEQYGIMIDIPNDAYLVKTETGYLLYDSTGEFISNIVVIDESLNQLEIKNQEDIP